ncbi:MAG TPA: TetR/AcrR family transcriptional regulator [Polyangiaceae bacterium]
MAKPKRTTAIAKDERVRLELDERRAQLVALALAVFSKHAYDEVSIDDFARQAKISKGLVYHYFPTKRHLYVAGLREAARQLMEAVEPPSTPLLPDEFGARLRIPGDENVARIRQALDAYFDFVESRGPAFVALMRGGIGSDPEIARVVEETRLKLMQRILKQAPKEIDRPIVRSALRGWIGFVEAASIRWLEKADAPREAIVKICLDVFFATVASAVTK